ncbi:MAG: Gfo/Idh/MocA family oxidoreductase, partial [bacterium]|nr:Gfo/Idh/MocA family oxidoreductase [bacterium]
LKSINATRRGFIGAVTAASYQRILGANDRIQLGLIGYGLIGAQHVETFKQHKDMEFTGICDVYKPRVEAGLAACGSSTAKGYSNFRELLENKDIQGVIIAVPDQWHALQTMLACAAGKDVYVEKPMTLFQREGQWMVKAARHYKRVVQVGTQQRSGLHYQKALKLIREDYIGRVHSIRIASYRNASPGFGDPPDGAPPADLDYNMWLGPAPLRAYNPHRSLYHFRWFWDYSGGQMTNLGQHSLDIVQWIMQVKGPKAVVSCGGRFALSDDNGNTPDTQDAILEYVGGGWTTSMNGGMPGFTVSVSIREACRGVGGGFEFCGTKGSMTIGRGGFKIRSDRKVHPANLIPNWSNPPGHPPRSDAEPGQWLDPIEEKGSSPEQLRLHSRNFLDCIKSRKRPIADVEDGHEVVTACHLANISLWVGRKLQWDVAKEEIIGDPEASAHLLRPYREPWDEVLKSIKV